MYYSKRPTATEYAKRCITDKYVDFKSRASRSEHWYFVLFQVCFYIIIGTCLFVFGGVLSGEENMTVVYTCIGIMAIFAVLLVLPNMAVTVRRFHDTGNSGWLYLINFIPYIGGLVVFIFMVLPSQPYENKWGPHPYLEQSEDVLDHLEV